MNDRYYKPNIEEFHVGFEYWLKSKEPTSTKRVPIVINSFSDVQDAVRHFAFDDIVVKYLSKEDIESFGFKQTEENQHTYMFSKINKDKFNTTIKLHKYDYGRIIITNDAFLFADIYIKNKSELKRLLVQLNAINS